MSAFLLAGCYEDKGNYDYIEIGSVKIDNVEESYTFQKYQTLPVEPIITVDKIDEKKLEFQWEVNGKVISTERVLAYEVMENFRPEPYICRLIVTNKTNDSKFTKQFNLMVVTPFYKGLTILSKVENEEAMLSYCPYTQDNKSEEVIQNVFFNENDYKMEGRPISMQAGSDWDAMEGDLFINTSKGSYAVTSGIMKVANHYGVDKMMVPESDIDIKGISLINYNSNNYGGFIANGKVYPISSYNPYFSLPSADPCPVYGKPDIFIQNYDLSEYFIARTNDWGSRLGIIAYDNTMGRFISFASSVAATDTEQMATATPKDTLGLKMFYMGMAETNDYKHAAILHSGTYDSWVVIPFFATNYPAKTPRYPLASNYLNKESKVIIETNYSKLYYSSGNKIYFIFLNDTNKRFESNEFEIEGLGNETITMMKFKDWREQVIYIGLGNKIYEVDMATQKILNTIEGFQGVPVDVFYK